jgi:FkbM family methyltransferase
MSSTFTPLISLGALAPPAFKTRLWQRVFARCSRGRATEIESNLGVAPHLRVAVPADHSELAFGRPTNNPTERTAIRLVQLLSDRNLDFLDVGSNYGVFSFVAEAHYRRVFAFEPDPRLSERLSSAVQRNQSTIEVQPVAVGDCAGSLPFFINLDDDSMGSLSSVYAETHRTKKIDVEVVCLAEWIDKKALDRVAVKIDVEGYGLGAWNGLKAAADKIEFMIVEVTAPEAKDELPQRIIEEGGFNAFYLEGERLRISRKGEFTYVAPYWNWLFTRLSPQELQSRLGSKTFNVG